MSSERIARILDFHGMRHYQDKAGRVDRRYALDQRYHRVDW